MGWIIYAIVETLVHIFSFWPTRCGICKEILEQAEFKRVVKGKSVVVCHACLSRLEEEQQSELPD